jgi:putative endonuclease
LLLNKSKLSANRKLLGQWGENRCEKFLNRKGLKKLSRNFSCKTGEIDLIMLDKDGTIVFVEVKTRTGEDFAPAEAVITYGKKNRLFKTARYFLSINKIENRPCRFDTVVIILDNAGHEQIRHYENAFVM